MQINKWSPNIFLTHTHIPNTQSLKRCCVLVASDDRKFILMIGNHHIISVLPFVFLPANSWLYLLTWKQRLHCVCTYEAGENGRYNVWFIWIFRRQCIKWNNLLRKSVLISHTMENNANLYPLIHLNLCCKCDGQNTKVGIDFNYYDLSQPSLIQTKWINIEKLLSIYT